MAAIFVSHSHHDDTLASSLAEWLRANGFDDFYIDHETQRAGDKWNETLRNAKRVCRVVLCIVTPDWLMSDDCYGEFVAGWYLGRRIIPLLTFDPDKVPLDPKQQNRLNRLLLEDQGIFLAAAVADDALGFDRDPDVAAKLKEGLRAAGALAKIGLDPAAFDVDTRTRPEPFPGLQSFGDTDGDAALFFGRSQEIASCLEDLRQLRATGDRRAYVILGASGSGKSSLMKAGILPRIRRERSWFVVRVFRPGGDPLLAFSEALAATGDELHMPLSSGATRERLLSAWRNNEDMRAAIDAIVTPLKVRAHREDATTLIAFDQGEELGPTQATDSTQALLALMRGMLGKAQGVNPLPYMIMLTFRSDSFREFENLKGFEGIETRVQNIRALPVFRFGPTIEQPAARYGVQMEPELAEALMEDAEGHDALPLLAFTLQRLWRLYRQEGILKRSQYDSIGKLTGIIEDAAERAMQGLAPGAGEGAALGKVSAETSATIARIFIPALAQLNERGVVVRRTASLAALTPEDRAIVDRFAQWRLITTSGETFEVTHEAIFRKWPRLREWLERDKAHLETLRSVEGAAAAWKARGRSAADLLHRGKRLSEALALSGADHYRAQLSGNAEASAYLDACKVNRNRDRLKLGGAAAGVVATVLLVTSIPALFVQLEQADLRRRLNAAIEAARTYVPASRVLAPGESAAALPPLTVFRDCEACPEMVMLPPGEFAMGSPPDEVGRGTDEHPQHQITVAAFAAGRFDVTFDEWELCVQESKCAPVIEPSDYIGGRGRWPVVAVSWEDAKAYTAWLSARTGKVYRLFSETEWEYAARAGTTTAFYTGATVNQQQANFGNTEGSAHPVGSYPPNPFGLHDMIGSVWQWVEDCYNNSYNPTPRDGAPALQGDCIHRVIRGGSWFNEAGQVRSAMRNIVRFSDAPPHGGFRVARTLERS